MLKTHYYGHSCVGIQSANHKILIDPFFTDNPMASAKAEDVEADFILISHGHGDHVGDAVSIAKRCKATIIGNFELGAILEKEGATVHTMHTGGAFSFPFGHVKLTIAHHGGGYEPNNLIYAGPPSGILVTIDGKTIYHAGDTGLFYDMKLIGERNNIDLAFLPIGDNYTMGIEDAAVAAEFLKAKKVVPIHYNTWPIINADPQKFRSLVKTAETIIMKPGETIEF
jgi:L-ascorbate metabolism protein UlaG (beta-lactamase superfamily)